MYKRLRLASSFFLILTCLFLSIQSSVASKQYIDIDWIELMPDDDLEVFLNPPELFNDIQEGSSYDNLDDVLAQNSDNEEVRRYQQALSSNRVIESFNNKTIRIPGFIVPLESNEKNLVTQFFIVPYFGACLHLPPPPPNQIIFGELKDGIDVDELFHAFWFEGTIVIDQTQNDLGQSAYSMSLDNVYLYED